MTLSLARAVREDRLEEFIRQQEAAGYGSAPAAEFESTMDSLIRQPQSEDQTSRSPSGDGSTEK